MDQCPFCGETLQDVRVACGHCGEALPLQVIVVSEGSHGGGFALAVEDQRGRGAEVKGGDDARGASDG
jgi:hypothetical protein